MIEIVFGESAYGAFTKAQARGETDAFHGRAEDIYCFSLGLAVGDISDPVLGATRRSVLARMTSEVPSRETERRAEEMLKGAECTLAAVLGRYEAGEAIRIWYGHNPEDLCSLLWLMAQLAPLPKRSAVYLMELPLWEYDAEDRVVSHCAWALVSSLEWGRYVSSQKEAHPAFLSDCAAEWKRLQKENAPLRVLLNGRIQGMPEDVYDTFVSRELARMPKEFHMASLVGNVLGRYPIGVGDGWVSERIETLIGRGVLEIVSDVPEGTVRYRRVLRKCGE